MIQTYRLLILCRGVSRHVCICWYAYACILIMSGKGVEQCVASHLNKVGITANMSICPPQERKSTNGARRTRTRIPRMAQLFVWYHVSGIHHPIFITRYLLFCCWCPMRLRNVCWLPTSHSPHIKNDKQTRYKDTCMLYTDLHDGVWTLGTKHKAYQVISDHVRWSKIISDDIR